MHIKRWTHEELAQILGLPEGTDFRYSCVTIDEDGKLRQQESIEAILPGGAEEEE